MDNEKRVIVSIAFRPDDLAAVHKSAKRSGMKLSEFIREVAMARVHASGEALVSGASNNATVWADHVPGATL